MLRQLLPFAALLVGSWVGVGMPKPQFSSQFHGTSVSKRTLDDDGPLSPAIDERNLSQEGFPRLNPEARSDRAWLLAEGPRRELNEPRYVTFTFDDGPFPETTPYVLKTLRKYGVRATFFLVGGYLRGEGERAIASRETLRQIIREGHDIGNHTLHHWRLPGLDHDEALLEIDKSAQAIASVTGVLPTFFRPPYGALDAPLELALKDRNVELVLWNMEVSDMSHDDPDEMAKSMQEQLAYTRGGIILLHDIRWSTVKMLPKVLSWLDERRFDPEHPGREGYKIVDLPEYLRRTKVAPQPYADRAELEQARAQEFLHRDEGTKIRRREPRAQLEEANSAELAMANTLAR